VLDLECSTLVVETTEYNILDYEEDLFPPIKSTVSHETIVTSLKCDAFVKLTNIKFQSSDDLNRGEESGILDFSEISFEDCNFLKKSVKIDPSEVWVEESSTDNDDLSWGDPRLPKGVIHALGECFEHSDLMQNLHESFVPTKFIEEYTKMKNGKKTSSDEDADEDEDEDEEREERDALYEERMIDFYLSDEKTFPKALHPMINNIIRKEIGDIDIDYLFW
jgi:hypothetical protein